MEDKRSKLQIYTSAVKRLFMWHFLAPKLNLVLVTEFPKSGASWFCQMLSEAASIPFPRNKVPKLEQCIMQGHHLFHPRMGKSIAVMRDGRDVMVSAYFHFLFKNNRNTPYGVKYHKSKVGFNDYGNVIENMPNFIEYMFHGYAKKNMLHFSWSEFVLNIIQYPKKVCIIKYEDLLGEPVICLKRALSFYNLPILDDRQLQEIVNKYSFKNITNRNCGEEDRKSFVRKGVSGDWKNYFNEEACESFKKYATNELVDMRYEKDESWGAHF